MKNNIVLRILSIAVGIVFLFSGFMKLLDVAGFQNLIVQYGLGYFQYLAPLIVLIEILLGLALVLGIRQRITAIVSICMLLIFTGAFTYGYLVNSVEDCGCFGSLVKSTPTITYIRNVILLVVLIIVLIIDKKSNQSISQWKEIIMLSVMIPSVFAAGFSFKISRHHTYKHPFEGKSILETPLKRYSEVDSKRKLVLFMSYQCQHCWNSIENYKAYVEDGFVDTALCYAICNTTLSDKDSFALFFKESFPEVKCQEVVRDSINFVESTPTAFFIKDNRVEKIVIGGLPSPYLLFPKE